MPSHPQATMSRYSIPAQRKIHEMRSAIQSATIHKWFVQWLIHWMHEFVINPLYNYRYKPKRWLAKEAWQAWL
jgi:hypothetical protein